MKYLLSFGGNQPVEAEGSYDGETLTFNYVLDGTNFILAVSPDSVFHQTVGDGLTLEFTEGKRTVGTLRSGQFSAPYPIYCNKLKIDRTENDISIEIAFSDGAENRAICVRILRRNCD